MNIYPSKPLKEVFRGKSFNETFAGSDDAAEPVSQEELMPKVAVVLDSRVCEGRESSIFRRFGFMLSTWRALWKDTPPSLMYA